MQALSLGHTPTKAAELIGRPRRTLYAWRERDQEFAAAWDEALETGIDLLEQEARRRAFEGVERKVFYQGEEIAVERTFSDTLLIQLLRVRAPERWGRKLKVDASVEVDYAAEIMAARKRAGLDALPAAPPLPPPEITPQTQELAAARERAGLSTPEPARLPGGDYVPVGAVADALGDAWALALRVPVGDPAVPVLRLTPGGARGSVFAFTADLRTHHVEVIAGGEGCHAVTIAREILTFDVVARVRAIVQQETGGGHRSD